MAGVRFIKAGERLICTADVIEVDISRIEQWEVEILYRAGPEQMQRVTARGLDAVETVMLLKPSAMEGLRMVWPRLGWLVHNLVGHPLVGILDILATIVRPLGCHRPVYRWAIDIHDITTPRPRGMKK